MKRIQRKPLDGSPRFGAWISLAHPSIAEAFTRAGVDFLGLDLEHSTISLEQAQQLIAAAQAGGIPCLPRLSSHNPEQARRLLDAGADGLIVPNVSRPEEVARLIEWCKYPPVGARGFGVARAQGYGLEFDAYVADWNRRSTLIIQIESIQAVEAVDTLLRADEVDGVMVGPYDISGSLGVSGQLDHPRVQEACRRVAAACRARGKACGTQLVEPTEAGVAAALKAGYTFIVLASDVFILWKWADRMRRMTDAHRHPQGAPHEPRRPRVRAA